MPSVALSLAGGLLRGIGLGDRAGCRLSETSPSGLGADHPIRPPAPHRAPRAQLCGGSADSAHLRPGRRPATLRCRRAAWDVPSGGEGKGPRGAFLREPGAGGIIVEGPWGGDSSGAGSGGREGGGVEPRAPNCWKPEGTMICPVWAPPEPSVIP